MTVKEWSTVVMSRTGDAVTIVTKQHSDTNLNGLSSGDPERFYTITIFGGVLSGRSWCATTRSGADNAHAEAERQAKMR